MQEKKSLVMLRLAKRVTIPQAAAAAGVSTSSYGKAERGRTVGIDVATAIAAYYGEPLEHLEITLSKRTYIRTKK